MNAKSNNMLTFSNLIKTAKANYENAFLNTSDGDSTYDETIYLCESDIEAAYEDYCESGTTDDYLVYVLEGC